MGRGVHSRRGTIIKVATLISTTIVTTFAFTVAFTFTVAITIAVLGRRLDFDNDIAFLKLFGSFFPEADCAALAIDPEAAPAACQPVAFALTEVPQSHQPQSLTAYRHDDHRHTDA